MANPATPGLSLPLPLPLHLPTNEAFTSTSTSTTNTTSPPRHDRTPPRRISSLRKTQHLFSVSVADLELERPFSVPVPASPSSSFPASCSASYSASQTTPSEAAGPDHIPDDHPPSEHSSFSNQWSFAFANPDAMAPGKSSSEKSLTKDFLKYNQHIFQHRSIRFVAMTAHSQRQAKPLAGDVSQVIYDGDLVSPNEDVHNERPLSEHLLSLSLVQPNERRWETEIFFTYFFLQISVRQGLANTPDFLPMRELQYTIKSLATERPNFHTTISPPIIKPYDLCLSIDSFPAAVPLLLESKNILDLVYVVEDKNAWGVGRKKSSDRLSLPGYAFLNKDSSEMLPYLLVENKRYTEPNDSSSLESASVYLASITASILHQRLKLRTIGGMKTTLANTDVYLHCFVMIGPEAHHFQAILRKPCGPDTGSKQLFVRYEFQHREIFNLNHFQRRNAFKDLLRGVHAYGKGRGHDIQKEEIAKALHAIDSDPERAYLIKDDTIAFHWVADISGDMVLDFISTRDLNPHNNLPQNSSATLDSASSHKDVTAVSDKHQSKRRKLAKDSMN